jgi:hypothetical protein
MRRSLSIAFDDFGRAAITAEAERYRLAIAELVGQALEYYLADRTSGRPGLRVPRFGRAGAGAAQELALDLPGRVWEEAEAEAERQGVPLERLLEHAAMYLVADLDSGKVAARIAAASISEGR